MVLGPCGHAKSELLARRSRFILDPPASPGCRCTRPWSRLICDRAELPEFGNTILIRGRLGTASRGHDRAFRQDLGPSTNPAIDEEGKNRTKKHLVIERACRSRKVEAQQLFDAARRATDGPNPRPPNPRPKFPGWEWSFHEGDLLLNARRARHVRLMRRMSHSTSIEPSLSFLSPYPISYGFLGNTLEIGE